MFCGRHCLTIGDPFPGPIIISERRVTAVLLLVWSIAAIRFSITLPRGRYTAVISRSTAKLWRRRAVSYTRLVVVGQVEEVRTRAWWLVETRSQQTEVRTSSIVRSTRVLNWNSNVNPFTCSENYSSRQLTDSNIHRHRSSVNFRGARHFCPKICMKN